MKPQKSAYQSMALVILQGLDRTDSLLPIVVNQGTIDALATRTEKNLPEYEHEPLTKALWKLIKDGRKEEATLTLGKGYYEISILVHEARGEYLKQQIDFFERMARQEPDNELWSRTVGDYRARLLEFMGGKVVGEMMDGSPIIQY